jgi:8-oxo-dGTP pyrophosphatase MutT (NUDIX family)
MTARDVRYQAAVVHGGRLLLIHCVRADGHSFWHLPGGGREGKDEDAAACVAREVREETHLVVRVERLLDAMAAHPRDPLYRRWRTYLCTVVGGVATPGEEPEVEAVHTIDAVRWLALHDEAGWEVDLAADPILAPQLRRIRQLLDPARAPTPPAATAVGPEQPLWTRPPAPPCEATG